MADRDSGMVFEAGSITAGDYLRRWLTDCVAGTVSTSTYENRRTLMESHLIPAFSRVKLKDLSPAHIRSLYSSKREAGLSTATIRKLHAILHRALGQAVRDGLLPRNVTEAADPPKLEAGEIKPLSKEQATLLLEAAAGDRYEALYVLAVQTGMRQGELLGLKWPDIDFEASALQVRRSLSETKAKGLILTAPKTRKAVRRIKLPARSVTALKEHRIRQNEERLALGGPYSDNGLVFATELGTPVNRHNLRQRSFKPLLEKASLPDVRFYDLRHTFATIMLSEGVNPKVVSDMMGHSTVAMTLNTYSHVLPSISEAAASVMEGALG
jgi:integrase